MKYSITPIGHVEKEGSDISLVIEDLYWAGTKQLEHFSHAIVLWWITGRDNPSDRETLIAFPPKNKGPEASGVFACRSPFRPNPIGHTIVKIEQVKSEVHRILIDHMDADSGSSIIDIKPYLPTSDRVDNAKVAPWFIDLIPRYY